MSKEKIKLRDWIQVNDKPKLKKVLVLNSTLNKLTEALPIIEIHPRDRPWAPRESCVAAFSNSFKKRIKTVYYTKKTNNPMSNDFNDSTLVKRRMFACHGGCKKSRQMC